MVYGKKKLFATALALSILLIPASLRQTIIAKVFLPIQRCRRP